MSTYSFGSGVLLAARTDIANATPVPFGMMQEVTLDLSATSKELYGQFQFPVAVARGQIKATGKAKVASLSGMAMASLFFGQMPAGGQLTAAYQEAGTIPGASTYIITVANSATFVDDYGVTYLSDGLPLTKVASNPTTGQYSVAAGVYTFAAADTGLAVLISYAYTVASTGQKFTVTNQLLGTTPTFQCQFYSTFEGKVVSVKIRKAISNKLSIGTKLEDFVMPEFDFAFFADESGNVMDWSFSEQS